MAGDTPLDREGAALTGEAPEGAVPVGGAPDGGAPDGAALTGEALVGAALDGEALVGAVEALLIVADEPLDEQTIAQACGVPVPAVSAAIATIAAHLDGRQAGFQCRRTEAGWRFFTARAYAPIVERYLREGQQARLTQAALETLAIVAYRQPISRGRVGAIRGVSVDGVIRTLLGRGLIEEAGPEAGSGAQQYRTTEYFLDRLGLTTLADLPPVADYLPDLAALDDLLDDGP